MIHGAGMILQKAAPPPPSGATVKKTPTGPPAPPSGWSCVFGDAFVAPIGSAAGQDNLWLLPSGYEHGEEANMLQVYNAGQVHQDANGLKLVAHHEPNAGGTGKDYVSGRVQTEGGRFTLRSYAGATFAMEVVCQWPRNGGAADPAFWHDGSESGVEQEIDDFEGFGWNADGSIEYGAAMPACVGLGGHTVFHTEGVVRNFGFDPAAGFHRYTTVVKPSTTAGKTLLEEYIDGVFKWAFTVATPSVSVKQHIIISYALREYPERVLPEDTTFAIRSVAVYQDTAHLGQFTTGGGIAPGTVLV